MNNIGARERRRVLFSKIVENISGRIISLFRNGIGLGVRVSWRPMVVHELSFDHRCSIDVLLGVSKKSTPEWVKLEIEVRWHACTVRVQL